MIYSRNLDSADLLCPNWETYTPLLHPFPGDLYNRPIK
jgi:hypothetical protein